MPIYEYKCTKCDKTDTELRPIRDRHDLSHCPKAGCGGTMKLAHSASSFVMDPARAVVCPQNLRGK